MNLLEEEVEFGAAILSHFVDKVKVGLRAQVNHAAKEGEYHEVAR